MWPHVAFLINMRIGLFDVVAQTQRSFWGAQQINWQNIEIDAFLSTVANFPAQPQERHHDICEKKKSTKYLL